MRLFDTTPATLKPAFTAPLSAELTCER
jgi:hypothetical protein